MDKLIVFILSAYHVDIKSKRKEATGYKTLCFLYNYYKITVFK